METRRVGGERSVQAGKPAEAGSASGLVSEQAHGRWAPVQDLGGIVQIRGDGSEAVSFGSSEGSPAMLCGNRDIGMDESGLVSALGSRSPMDHNGGVMAGTEMTRTTVEVMAAVGLTGLVVYAWLRLRRRSWSVSRRDESMRRHISQHYS